MRNNKRGVTLLELMIAVVMVSGVVITLAILVPKASANITNNRRRFLASNFAAADIQQIKEQPYALISSSPTATTGYFPVSGITNPGGCDCSRENMSGMPVDATYTEDGVTYTRTICINLVNHNPAPPPNWTSYCPNNPLTAFPFSPTGPDFGLKNIRVQVSWTYNGNTQTFDTESQVTR
jgi:Tfp pilus assembly protein PilE